MSRIGVLPIKLPAGVDVSIDGKTMTVRGAKGEQNLTMLNGTAVEKRQEDLLVTKTDDSQEATANYGLMRTLLANAVTGVSEGFSKSLEINGVGFKVQVSGNKVTLNLGYSHPHEVTLPEGIEASTEGNILTISGNDKQMVGQVAANIRALRKPEPYKGKGVKYVDERIIRKTGKAAAGAGK